MTHNRIMRSADDVEKRKFEMTSLKDVRCELIKTHAELRNETRHPSLLPGTARL